MQLYRSQTFIDSLTTLTAKEQKSVIKKIRIFEENPRHPSLRTQKMEGTEAIWEMSVSLDLRITWQYYEDGVLLRNVGHHDKVLRNP